MKKTIMFIFLITLFFPLTLFGSGKKILVIESYHAEYPWDISYKKGIENKLGQDHELIYYQMDTKRLPASLYEERARLAFEVYEQTQPDLVMLGDDNALKFLGPRLAEKSTPVVFLGINNNPRDYNIANNVNITGILERPLMKRSIIYMTELIKPKMDKLLILFDSGITSKVSVKEMFQNRSSVNVAGVQVDLKLIGELSEWKKTVLSTRLKGYDAIIVGLYQTIVDENGKHVKAIDIINWTSKNTTVPPFGFWDFTVGPNKTIGGLVLFGQTQGEAAATLVRKIFDGTPPGKIAPVIGKKGRFYFSKSQLKKWNLTLPDKITAQADFTD